MIKPKQLYGFIFLLSLISQFIYSNEIDSLQQLLSETHDASKKIELYTQLSASYVRSLEIPTLAQVMA